MPLLHCLKCDHEWEQIVIDATHPLECSWCGTPGGQVLAETTPMEETLKKVYPKPHRTSS
jgi:hypothetical protein